MRKRHAFTLVELLVVIGIIALLISILLPALSRARAQANSVDCQARLRQVGMGLQLYATGNNGVYPWGMLNHGAPHLSGTVNPYPNEQWWKWHYTVSQMLGTDNMKDNNSYWGPGSQVFIDKDTIEGQPWGWRSDYIANPRVLLWNDGDDAYPPTGGTKEASQRQRRIASIRRPSEAMAVWCAPQWSDYGNSSIEIAQCPGGWQYSWGTYFISPNVQPSQTWIDSYYNQVIPPGNEGGDGALLQKKWNKDFAGTPWGPVNAGEFFASAFRFRHMGNTTLNALFVDGHCEPKKVGEILYKDICTSPY
jgi:prepilin-type N-terminal cleavage/methylation domain-containing protein/prepilin-type processing-associated H-X9-DG protein